MIAAPPCAGSRARTGVSRLKQTPRRPLRDPKRPSSYRLDGIDVDWGVDGGDGGDSSGRGFGGFSEVKNSSDGSMEEEFDIPE